MAARSVLALAVIAGAMACRRAEPGSAAQGMSPSPAVQSVPSTGQHFEPRTTSATRGNFLINADFEAGPTGWRRMEWSPNWGPFEIAAGHASSGTLAAHLPAHGGPLEPQTRVFGVAQDVVSPRFPTRISGRYFVERWEPGAAHKVYVQLVIIAMRTRGSEPTMQIRYILDGVTAQPYQMSNARYVFVHERPTPELSTWVDFSIDVAADYRRIWGQVPPDGTGWRALFEARYDDKPPRQSVAVDVWYDDLFVGVP